MPTGVKAHAFIAKWLLLALASAWIVMGVVWSGLHFVIVPRIGEWRPWLQEQASVRLGIPVRITSVEARSLGLIPSVTFSGVEFLDARGRVALRLPTVTAALSLRSLFGLGFEQLYTEGLELDVRRSVDGRLWIAGLAVPTQVGTDATGLDWLFAQTELALRHGVVRWTDELRGAQTLELRDVDVVLRNRHRTHSIRVQASPPPAWGARFDAQGVFREPLLSRHPGAWRQWVGQLYVDLPAVDVAQWRPYTDALLGEPQGRGAARAWIDWQKGVVTGVTADLALNGVRVQVGSGLQPLEFARLQGRGGLSLSEGGFEVLTQHLQFDTVDGLHWPGGNLRVRVVTQDAKTQQGGELLADHVDLQAVAQIAERLPLQDAVGKALRTYAPRGELVRLKGSWQGPWDKPQRFSVQGQLSQLALSASTDGSGLPGIQGVDLDFDLSEAGGRVAMDMRGGAVELPQWFEDSRIDFDRLSGELRWKQDGERLTVTVPGLRISNADAQGELRLKWTAGAANDALGVLDLQGSLVRGQLNRVHRYLPKALSASVRDYVRDAVIAGEASDVRFKVKGPLKDFPFAEAHQGEFRIAAELKDATFAYVPRNLVAVEGVGWPALNRLQGQFSIDGPQLQVKVSKAGVALPGELQLSKAEGTISKLYNGATLSVVADVRGPLADMLGFVNTSPLGGWMGDVLARSSANGNAECRFKLGFPLADVAQTTVAGAVTLTGNELQIVPESPRLTRATGSISFTDSGFVVQGVQALALGGSVRAEGGLTLREGVTGPRQLRLQGTATAEGLRQSKELGFVGSLARHAKGSAPYQVHLAVRDGLPALEVLSSMQGMELALPAPFTKAADTALPLRVEHSAIRVLDTQGAPAKPGTQDHWLIDVGNQVHVVYQRDIAGTEPRVLRGAIAVGLAADETAALPVDGVVANVALPQLDVDAWREMIDGLSVGGATDLEGPLWSYVPNTIALRAKTMTLGARALGNVVVGASRDGALWRANVQAAQGEGYLEYRPSTSGNAGRLYARLPRLAIGPSTAQEVESLLDQQPTSIPALDIVVDDFELRGKRLGRLEIEAINMGATLPREPVREWRLNRFNLRTPDATLTTSGNWSSTGVSGRDASVRERRRTAMNLRLDIADAGALLARLGMPGVVRNGRGRVEGQMAWLGSPITLDYPSLSGQLHVNVESGQFLQADPGIAKLLGVLSLQSLPRRLTLDFRDVFSDGFAFDFFRGDVDIGQGMARTNNLQMKGVNAAVLMEGEADIARETQAIKVVVIPEINAGSASLIASVINPLVGLSTFLAQVVLRTPLIDATTREFFIDGTWVDPRIHKVERKEKP